MARRNGCSGKRRHPRLFNAMMAIKHARNKQLVAYFCGRCGGWHVGNSNAPWKVQARIDQLLEKSK